MNLPQRYRRKGRRNGRLRLLVTVLLCALVASASPTAALAQTDGPPELPVKFDNLLRGVVAWAGETFTGGTDTPVGGTRPASEAAELPGRGPAVGRTRPPGKRTKELTGQRSRFGTVYELEDGRRQAELSVTPLHYRDSSGRWQKIDTSVTALSGMKPGEGFVSGNDGAGFGSRFGNTTDKLLNVRLGDRQVTFGLAGQARPVSPQVTGSKVTYHGVWDGADLVFKVTPVGVKEYIVLSKPPAPDASFAFTVRSDGVRTEQRPDGSIVFTADGMPVFSVPKPFMLDAQPDATSPYGRRHSEAVTQSLEQHADQAVITVKPDAGWLAAADRKWPVVVDPTVKIVADGFGGMDAYVSSAAKTTNYDGSWKLPVGRISSSGVSRALLYFNLSDLPVGAQISDARLQTYFDQALGETGPVTVEAREITAAWTSFDVTWNTQPTFANAVSASVTRQPGELNRWHSFEVTGVVNRWLADIETPANGFVLKAADESAAAKIAGPVYEAGEDVYGGDGMTGETTTMPRLLVTYGAPSVVLNPVTTVSATGARLSWTPYQDPTPNDDSDDIVEYQVHRHCPSGCGGVGADTLVTPLPADVTSYTDTTGGGDPEAVADPSYVHEATYWIVVRTKDGRDLPSQQLTVVMPKPGHISKILYGGADTTIASGEPNTSHDTISGRNLLQVGNTTTAPATTRAALKFDDFATEIPADAQVSEATLSLWNVGTSGSGASFAAHKLTRAFDENATWTKADGSTTWTAPGGDFTATALGTVAGLGATPGWRTWTVTTAAKDWVADQASAYGLLVKVANEAGSAKQSASFLSGEADGEPLLRPRLRVTYLEKTDGASAFYAPETPVALDAGENQTVRVSVTNTTDQTWPAASTSLGYRWQLPDETDVTDASNEALTALPMDLAPGETAMVNASIKAPVGSEADNAAEPYTLAWDVKDTLTGTWKSSSHHLPRLPQLIRIVRPTSDFLGSEKFYSYTGKNTGAGSTALVNPHTGNLVWNYNALSNPSRGISTFVRATYNSLDTSNSVMGHGWSLQTSTVQRLGSPLEFLPWRSPWPAKVRLTDGDGTSHLWTLDTHGRDVRTCTPATCDYTHPRGIHLYLQRTGSTDPRRSWVMTKPDRTQFFFDDEGYQSAIVDKNGNTMSFTYERALCGNRPGKYLRYITDAAGRRTLTLDYYKRGQKYSYIGEDGQEAQGTRLTNPYIADNLASVTDISGRKVTFTYTARGQLARLVDGAGDAQAKTFRFVYDAPRGSCNVKLTSVTDPRGNATRFAYRTSPLDFSGRSKLATIVDRLGGTTRVDYVSLGGTAVRATVTDPLSHAATYTFDGYGRAASVVNAKNETTALEWDEDHNVTKLTEANNAVSTWRYDSKTGYPLELRDAEAVRNGTPATVLGYQTALNGYVADLIGKTSPQGRGWAFGYDTKGNLKTVTDPLGVATPTAGDYTTSYDYDVLGQLTKVTDANGNPTTYGSYHSTGYPEKITDAYGKVTTTAYDVRGDVLSVTDALGKRTTQTYDLFGRPLENKAPKDQDAGAFVVTPAPVYDPNDNITRVTAPNGAVSTAVYDKADQLLESLLPKDVDDGPERRASFTYDLAGNLLTQVEPKGNLTAQAGDFTTTYVYDPIYQLTDVINADQKKITYSYDNVGNTVKVVDPRKNATPDTTDYTTTYTYDRAHRPIEARDAAGHRTTTDYDLDGLVVGTTDQEGNKTLLTLDKRGDVVETRVPHAETDGTIKYVTTRFVYDQAGNQTQTVTPRGVETADDPTDFIAETRYDKLNRPVEEIYPFDQDDPRFNTPDSVKYVYDELSRLKEVSAPPSHGQTVRNVTRLSYWDTGWTKTSTDPWDITTAYDYNALGLQTNRTVTSAGGSSQRAVTWSYFPDGKLKTHADNGVPLDVDVVLADNSDTGQTTATGSWKTAPVSVGPHRDFTGFDYATASAGSGANRFTWSLTIPVRGSYKVYVKYPAGATATDAAYTVKHDGKESTAKVDQRTHAGEWVSIGTFAFVEGGAQSVTLTDRASGTVAADSVKLVHDNGAADSEKKDFVYSYDPNANLTRIVDNSANAKIDTWDIGYTGLNQVERIIEKLDDVVKNTTAYTYNENGAPTRRTHDKTVATYDYDVRDLVERVTNAKSATDTSPKVTSYTYTARAERLRETKANGNTVDYDYFLDGLLRHSIEKKPNGTLVSEHTIGYQGNLQRSHDLSKIQNADNPGTYLENDYTYTYDPRDRIARSVKTPASGAAETETYLHDANGNLYEETVGGKTTTFAFDRDRLTSSVTAGATTTYTYDPYGRLRTVNGGGQTLEKYTYDGFDHIARHDKLGEGGASTVTTYTYDPLDRTTSKTEKTGTATAKTTAYSYLGLSEEVLDEEVAGKLTRSFQYSPWGERLSQVKAKADGGEESSYYGYNAHTDVETLTSETGDTRATYGYTAYGKNDDKLFTGVDRPDPADPGKDEYNPYRFNAKRWDNSTGTYDMGFRDYSPGLNRFLTLDFYDGALDDLGLGLDPWTSNRYAFTGGNPIGIVEIDGHFNVASSDAGGIAPKKASSPTPPPPVSPPKPVKKQASTTKATPSPKPGEDINAYFQQCQKIGHEKCNWGKSEIAALYDLFAADYVDCAKGDGSSCAWAAVGILAGPLGRGAEAAVGVLRAGSKAVRAGNKMRKASKACRQSFVPGTEVLMADGTRKPIEDVKVGDEVLATDPETGKTEARPVIALITGEDDKNLVQITVDTDGKEGNKTGLVIATEIHPFWVPELHRWVDARDLTPGMSLRTSAGTYVQISAIKKWSAYQRVHNLTVADLHTYYVVAGAAPILVHNSGPCENIALGLSEVDGDPMALLSFADSKGAKSYHDWPSGGDNWVSEFKDFVKNGKTSIHFNLDGIEDPVAAAGAGSGLDPIFDGHATAWELSFIRDNPSSWPRVTFYRNGAPVANPFVR
ncbi:DNRLRE domain-containing protein [Streptosporangium sp. NPDC020072]|uniref:DNRLRE domain-containing protein n=1 Tax=Streptosporangium sp. NPDC020072 TaxID=3154788 RepID=UPI003438E497